MNNLPNTSHATLSPSMIFTGVKLDVAHQSPVPFGTYAALHYSEKTHVTKGQTSSRKNMFKTENGIVLRLADNNTSNIGWVPDKHKCRVCNKYTVIKKPF